MNKLQDDMMARVMSNPLASVFPEKELFAIDKYFADNCRTIRGFFRDIIEMKKKVKDSSAQDIISLLLHDPNYQDADDIVDDIIVMYFAGSKTIQATTSNVMTSLIFNPEVHKKLLNEVDPYMASVKDDIMGKMTLEGVEDLEYTKMCY